MGKASWGLEVVKGRTVGRMFPLAGGSTVLGNDLKGRAGIDLATEEGTSPRRMAAQQAEVVGGDDGLSVRDLDSPGGTFVNRQRLLAGQTRRLELGDVIQVGGVQLRVVAQTSSAASPASPVPAAGKAAEPTSTSTSPPPRPGTFPVAFRLANGTMCRSWDDFLTASARSWSALREELTSGRLGTFLSTQGHGDLRPLPAGQATPDERLDAWLARIPSTRPARPELEVHPAVLRLRATPGGGLTRSKVVVTSTGYRLLRSTARVETPGAGWVRLAPAFSAPFTTTEQTEIPVEVDIPETVNSPLTASLVIESNGGTRRVEVRVEPATKVEPFPEPVAAIARGPGLRERLAGLSTWARIGLGAGSAGLLRGIVALADRVATPAAPAVSVRPALLGPAVALATVGALVAAPWALRRGERRDLPAAAFGGGFAGVLLAALAVAACHAVEPAVGTLGATTAVDISLWALLGATAGAASIIVLHPPQPDTDTGETGATT